MRYMRIGRLISHSNIRSNQFVRFYARKPFPSKVAHYLYRAKFIDSIRISLRLDPSTSLAPILNNRLLDSFVVTNAIRSAPSADSALFFCETLEKNPHFSHNQSTINALATVLAKNSRSKELKSLVDAVSAGKFVNVCLSFMNLMQWFGCIEDLESVIKVWEEYRRSDKGLCAESYNVVMQLYAQQKMDAEALEVFRKLIDEGVKPNCRTYTIIIDHLVSSGKISAALQVFNMLPLMRIKHTGNQYSVLVKGLVGAKRFEDVKTLLNCMEDDGKMPTRNMSLSLQYMKDAGFVDEVSGFLREMAPDERIKNIVCGTEDSDEEEDDDEVDENVRNANGDEDANRIKLKPWLDPRALAKALNPWSPSEVSALENAKIVWTTQLVCKILRNFRSPKTAWEFFCWVAYQPGFVHDIYTVQRMIVHLARHGCVELVDNLISKVRREGMRLPFCTIKLIIDFYGISKNADAALKIFRNDRNLCGPISELNLMLLYSSLLRTLTKCGLNSETLNVLDEMILNGISPDLQTYLGLMHYFALQGDITTVQKLFSSVRQSGLEPDAHMFKVLIGAYCISERASLAWRVFEDMRNYNVMPDNSTRDLLVNSLWKEGKRREAAAVLEACEEVCECPRALPGDLWTFSSSDLTKVYDTYSSSFKANGGEICSLIGLI